MVRDRGRVRKKRPVSLFSEVSLKRPHSVTFLMFTVLCLTAWNAIRLFASIADWNLLAEFAPRPGPVYIAVSATFWTLSGVALWITIRRRSPRARLATAIISGAYALWWWADRLLLQAPRPNWPFAIVATILILAMISILLYHPHTRAYLQARETHEQTPTDSNPA
jgi:hypothetical protein